MKAADKTRYASIIHSETIRLTRLLDDLLDLSVLENGQVTLNLRTGQVADVMDQSVITALASAAQPLKIIRDPEAEAVTITTDIDRLAQVFINLIANAQKYCRADDPQLTIHVQHDDQMLTVDFVDNGEGIAADAQVVIFEKFFRISGEVGDGAGLGLAICHEIMTRLGGEITYLPNAKGTAFRVRLPLHVPAARSETPALT